MHDVGVAPLRPKAVSLRAGRHAQKEPEDSASTATVSDSEEASSRSTTSGETPVAGAEATPEFWSRADVGSIRGFEGLTEVSHLLGARFVSCPMPAKGQLAPWGPGRSEELYQAMGMRDPAKSYVVCWLNFGNVSLVFVSETTDPDRLQAALAPNALQNRLKFITNAVRVGVPVPLKGPKDAETVGAFFGPKNSSLSRARAANGAEYAVVQIDMASKTLLRLMLNKVAFREGNVVEMLVADWEGRAVLTSVRVDVTPEALRQMGR